MSALGLLLTLAVQVVTLDAADLPAKPVYLRVGVGVDSRLTLPESLVRLHGHRATSDLLGLKLGQARPQTVLLLHPRNAGTGRLLFVGPTHTLRLVVEASSLGAAQDVELKVVSAEASVGRPVVRATGRVASNGDGMPRPPAPSPNPSPSVAPSPADDGEDGAMLSSAPSLDRRVVEARSADLTVPESPPAGPRTDGAPIATLQLAQRVGRPGQPVILIEDVRREGGQLVLRLRVEGAAQAQGARLDIAGEAATVAVATEGHDLRVVGTRPWPTRLPGTATLTLLEAGRWRRATVALDSPHIRAFFDGGSP